MRDLEKYLSDFDSLPFEDVQARYRKKNLAEILGKLPAFEKVIEVGCGESSIFEYQRFHTEAIIEPIPEFIARLNDRVPLRGMKIFAGTLENCVVEQTYDLVVASCILHEVDDPIDFLDRLIALVAEGGYLYLDVPNATSFHRHLAVETGFLDDVYGRTTTQTVMQQANVTYDMHELKSLIEGRGAEVVDCSGYFMKPFHHQRMMNMLDAGFLSERDLDGLFQLGKQYPHLASEIYALCKTKRSIDD